MKKFLCLSLTVLLLLGLLGCSGEKIFPNDQNKSSDPQTLLGSVENNVYKNDFLGLRFTLPENWVFYTEDEIRELNNLTTQYFDEDAKKQIENATLIYNMNASHPESGCSTNLNMEKLSTAQLGYLNIEASLKAQFDMMKNAYENIGYTDVEISYQKVSVSGKELDGVRLTANLFGVKYYGTSFSFRKDNYLANVFVGSLLTDQTADILSHFSLD